MKKKRTVWKRKVFFYFSKTPQRACLESTEPRAWDPWPLFSHPPRCHDVSTDCNRKLYLENFLFLTHNPSQFCEEDGALVNHWHRLDMIQKSDDLHVNKFIATCAKWNALNADHDSTVLPVQNMAWLKKKTTLKHLTAVFMHLHGPFHSPFARLQTHRRDRFSYLNPWPGR